MKISDLKNYTVLPSGDSSPNSSTTSPSMPPKSTGQKILDAGTKVSNFFGGKGVADTFGATIAKVGKTAQEKDFISQDQPTVKQTIGSGIQLGANFLPGVGKGASFAAKALTGIGTGYALDVGSKLQNNSPKPFEPGVGTAVGAALPIAGAVTGTATKIMGRLFKGLGSGLSGVSTDTIDKIVNNPETAMKASKKLAETGNNKVLENNAKTILNGVTKIQNEASSAYRSGLDKLSEVDIKPDQLKKGIEGALQKNKIGIGNDGLIDFSGADFLDPKVQQKAESIINQVGKQEDLSGTGIRKLMDMVDNARFKSAPDGDRQAFNAFIGDLKQGLKDGINASTDKLSEINSKYSADMQLSEAAQNIFGNVDFKNLSEVAKAAKKLESMFSQKGLDPKIVDDYLTRIGENPANFKTSEAVRQISNKTSGANSLGTSLGEITRSATSAIITPEMVKNLSIATGLTREKLAPFLRVLKPSARKIVIQALLQANQGNSAQSPQQPIQ